MASTASTPHARRLTLVPILVAMITVNALALSLIVPSLPTIQDALATDFASVQMVLSAYLIALAVGQLIVGPLADRYGRRPVLFAGLTIYIVGAALATVAPSITILVLTRVMQGFGSAAGMAISRAIVRDLFDQNRAASVLGYVTMGLAVTPMVAPTIGGIINDAVGWRAVFAVIAVAAACVTLTAYFVLPETNRRDPDHSESILRGIVALLKEPIFWGYSLITALVTSTYLSFIGGSPFVATTLLGLNATQFGIGLLFVSGGYMVGNFFSGRYSERAGTQLMIHIGNVVTLMTLTGMGITFLLGGLSPFSLFVPMAFLGFGNGLTMPNAMAGAVSVRPDLAGTASGLGGSMQFAFGSVASFLAAALLTIIPDAMSLLSVMWVCAALALLVGFWVQYLQRYQSPVAA